MVSTEKTKIEKNPNNKQLRVTREFAAPVDKVWRAWTEQELLDQWWAPKPWQARTKKMDFREGGKWLYAMVGPDDTTHWATVQYKKIVPNKSFSGTDAFCDENGKISDTMPSMEWECNFTQSNGGTMVTVDITFHSEEDLKAIVEMGFKEGFTAAHDNLDELLAK